MKPPKLWGWAPLECPANDQRWNRVHRHRLTRKLAISATMPLLSACDAATKELIDYRPDNADRWEWPDVTLERGHGDCEDFAIMTRALLIQNGIADDRIFFLIARDLIARADHAMLLVEGPDHVWLLDSQSPPMLAKDAKNYAPRFAYWGARCWLYGRDSSA